MAWGKRERESIQSILKEIKPEYSLEGLMLKLKIQYFGHLMQRLNSLEKTLMLGKIEGKRRRGHQRMSWLDNITDSMDMNLSKLWEIVKGREAWHAVVHRVAKNGSRLSDWTTMLIKKESYTVVYKGLWIFYRSHQGADQGIIDGNYMKDHWSNYQRRNPSNISIYPKGDLSLPCLGYYSVCSSIMSRPYLGAG